MLPHMMRVPQYIDDCFSARFVVIYLYRNFPGLWFFYFENHYFFIYIYILYTTDIYDIITISHII